LRQKTANESKRVKDDEYWFFSRIFLGNSFVMLLKLITTYFILVYVLGIQGELE